MKWESKVLAVNQMLSHCLCLFKIIPSPSWIIALPAAISLLFATYLVLGCGFLSVFLYTSLVLLFSTILYTTASNRHKAACVNELVEEKAPSSMEESSDQREDIAAPNPELQRETMAEAKEEEGEEIKDNGVVNNYSTRSPDLLSNSECQEMSTSEDSEVDYWPLDRSIDGSDGSISDEESLIEIALPSGHCSLKQQKNSSADQCLFSSTQQHSLMMELLAEYNDMNEEDNLIEIDISMGSIKSYSRFEIQA